MSIKQTNRQPKKRVPIPKNHSNSNTNHQKKSGKPDNTGKIVGDTNGVEEGTRRNAMSSCRPQCTVFFGRSLICS